MSCGGYELLAEVLASARQRADSGKQPVAACALQRELQILASQQAASLDSSARIASGKGERDGSSSSSSSSSSQDGGAAAADVAFTLLQDCSYAPCCPHELAAFAEAHPRAAVFGTRSLGAGAGTDGAAETAPSNMWRLDLADDLTAIQERRQAARACGDGGSGGCLTLQIAHALQGHPLLELLASASANDAAAADAAAVANRGDGSSEGGASSNGVVRRRLLSIEGDGADESLAAAQEAEVEALRLTGGQDSRSHSALLRAARHAVGGQRIIAASKGRVVGGPAAAGSTAAAGGTALRAAAAGGDSRARGEGKRRSANRAMGQAAALDESPPPPPAQYADDEQERQVEAAAEDAAEAAAEAAAVEPYEPIDASAGSDTLAAAAADGSDNALFSSAAHLVALGHVLRSARRTLLLLPAAEFLLEALAAAESRGLPRTVSNQLRSLLPYRSAREAERWLVDAGTAAARVPTAANPSKARADEPLKTLRVAGAAQKAAHAIGHLLVLVINGEATSTAIAAPLPSRQQKNLLRVASVEASVAASSAAAAAVAAGGLLLSTALGLRLDAGSTCRLRAALAHVPLREHRQHRAAGRWLLLGGSVLSYESAIGDGVGVGDGVGGGGGARGVRGGGGGGDDDDDDDDEAIADAAAASRQLDALVPAARDVVDALSIAEEELRRRGVCSNAQRPLVLTAPTGAARRVGACAVDEWPAHVQKSLRCGGAAAGSGAPRVLCADGVCRPTLVHCYRSLMADDERAEPLLARALPDCASAERRARLEEALPRAADLLAALASYHAADRKYFARQCADHRT